MAGYSHNANSLIPLMTANNAPAPVVISDSTSLGDAYKACDRGDTDTGWYAFGTSGWWKVYSGASWVITSYTIVHNYQYGTYPSAWTFLGSNDNVNWDTLDTISGQVFDSLEMKTYAIANTQPYTYYKINVTGNNGGAWVGFSEIELIGTLYTGPSKRPLIIKEGVTQELPDNESLSIGDGQTYKINGVPHTHSPGKLDDLAAPDDNTDLNASTTTHGLLLKATAPAAGLRNIVGIDNAETAYTNKALFDATALTAEAFGSTSSVGTAMTAARRDHRHAMPALPALDATGAPTDITTRNATTSAHGLIIKAVAPAAGLTNVPAIENGETVYKMKALFDVTVPSTQNFGDTADVGTAVTAARRDHKHVMPNLATLPVCADNAAAATAGVAVGGLYILNANPAALCIRTA